jgi:hypothetical protein
MAAHPKKISQTNMRLTPTARTLLQQLSEQLGLSQAAVVELALRQLAQRTRAVRVKTPE